MATLETITRGTAVRVILPDCLGTICDVRWIGTVAIEVAYKDAAGKLGNEHLYRNREPTLEVVAAGRPWSFDGDAGLFQLLSEANRIRLAYLFDPLLAVHTSFVELLLHQITAVCSEMLYRQPLAQNLRYDNESSIPKTGLFRFSDVKGRVNGAKNVTVKKDEILTALNKPDDFILAIADIDGDTTDVRYVRKPFEKEPDFKATSVNYDLSALLAQAQEPA